MKTRRWLTAAGLGLALAAAAVGVGVASQALSPGWQDDRPLAEGPAGSSDSAEAGEGTDSDAPLTGADADAAAAAALRYTDATYATGGRVSEVESGDDGAAFGVEVALPDGRSVEIHLDAQLAVTGDELDDD